MYPKDFYRSSASLLKPKIAPRVESGRSPQSRSTNNPLFLRRGKGKIYLHFGKNYDTNTFRTMHRFSLSLTSVLVCGTAWAQMPMLTPHVRVKKATRGQDRIMRRSIGHAEAIRKVQVRPAVEGFLSEI